MASTQTWTPIGITGVFIVTPSLTITDYFITDMANSCEYLNNSNWGYTFGDKGNFEQFRPSISSSC